MIQYILFLKQLKDKRIERKKFKYLKSYIAKSQQQQQQQQKHLNYN